MNNNTNTTDNMKKYNVSDKFAQGFTFITEEFTRVQSELTAKDELIANLQAELAKVKAANVRILEAYNAVLLGDTEAPKINILQKKINETKIENAQDQLPTRKLPTLERKMEDDWYRGQRAHDLIEDMLANNIEVTPATLGQLGVANRGSVYQIFRRDYAEAYDRQVAIKKLSKNEAYIVK